MVRVSDGVLSDTQALGVTVTNVDEALQFTSPTSLTTNESSTIAATVSAKDPDGSALADSIAGGANAEVFTIEAQTGVIAFAAAPDFEAPRYADANDLDELVITASDGSFAATNAVSVTISNLGEAVAITSAGGADSASLSVAEKEGFVAIVSAIDPDGAAPVYSIAGGADAGLFAIDAATGALSLIAPPNFEAPSDADLENVYAVLVAATDGDTVDPQ